jgi:hypothetical protein
VVANTYPSSSQTLPRLSSFQRFPIGLLSALLYRSSCPVLLSLASLLSITSLRIFLSSSSLPSYLPVCFFFLFRTHLFSCLSPSYQSSFQHFPKLILLNISSPQSSYPALPYLYSFPALPCSYFFLPYLK